MQCETHIKSLNATIVNFNELENGSGLKSQILIQEIQFINSMNTFQMLAPIRSLDCSVLRTELSLHP